MLCEFHLMENNFFEKKPHSIAYLKGVNFTIYKLYLNKYDFIKKSVKALESDDPDFKACLSHILAFYELRQIISTPCCWVPSCVKL